MNRLWIVDRDRWRIGEVAAFIVRASDPKRARELAAEAHGIEGPAVWADADVRVLQHRGPEGVVTTETATTLPCDEQLAAPS